MTATVTLDRNELLFDIYNRSHEEVKIITDVEARYRAEARQDKAELLRRFMLEAEQELRQTLLRFIEEDYTLDATDKLSADDTDSIILSLTISPRRVDNRIAQISARAHSYIVNAVLAKHYATVGQGDLAASHAQSSEADAADIERLVYHKMPPIL